MKGFASTLVVLVAALSAAEAVSSDSNLRQSVMSSLRSTKRSKGSSSSSKDSSSSSSKSTDPEGTPPHCIGLVGNPSNQDRYCEATDVTERAGQCGCKEQCHIWGDPHVEPFFSGCDILTLKEKGWYSFFQTDDVHVTGYSDDFGYEGKYWIGEIKVDGTTLLDVAGCNQNPKGRKILRVATKPKGYKNDVTIKIEAYCDKRGSDNKNNLPMHVNTYIEVIDDCTEEKKDTSSQRVPNSVPMFEDAAGICVNPCNNPVSYLGPGPDDYKKSAKRDMSVDKDGKQECQISGHWFWNLDYGSKNCKRRPNGIDGRVCSYSAQCSVHGDPYLTDFYTEMLQDDSKMCKTKGKKKQCIQVFPEVDDPKSDPGKRQAQMQTREYYMVPGQFQSQMVTDSCHLIIEMIVSYQVGKKVMTATYNAADLCPSSGTAGSTGVILKAPSDQPSGDKNIDKINAKVYDQYVLGYKLQGGDESTGVKTAPGALAINLKCHITNKKGNQAPYAYFNACLERYDGSETSNGDFVYNGDYQAIELGIKSRGWCSSGAVEGTTSSATETDFKFEYLNEDQIIPYYEECALGSKTC